MIILHIGLPKTASSLFLETIVKNTNVVLIGDIFGEDLSNKMLTINPSYHQLSQTDKISLTNSYFRENTDEDVAATSEASFKTIESLDLDTLDKTKVYLIKSPNVIISGTHLLERFKNYDHKIIAGVRNLIDMTYSLHYHWKRRGDCMELNKDVKKLYRDFLFRFYENMECISRDVNPLFYNFDRLGGLSNKDFIMLIFNMLNVRIQYNDNYNSDIVVNNHADVQELQDTISCFDEIEQKYNKMFSSMIVGYLH